MYLNIMCSRTGDHRPCTRTRTRTLRFRSTATALHLRFRRRTYDPVPLVPSMPLPRVVLHELFPSASQLFSSCPYHAASSQPWVFPLCVCTIFFCFCFDLDFTCPSRTSPTRLLAELSRQPSALASELRHVLLVTLASRRTNPLPTCCGNVVIAYVARWYQCTSML